ncbi:MAG: hypothetical protein WBE38_01845 [Terracidiphilus sp.]|jgi:hypothetical protein
MHWQAMGKIASAAALAVLMMAAPVRITAQAGSDTVLKAADVQKLLPASVFYDGQPANTQLRNSGGVKFADGHFVLAALVDNGGYSTGVAAKYQAYFVAEEPIQIGGQSLPAGVYGAGFIADNKFVVTDVGAHEVFTVNSSNDADMKRPMPLEFTTDPAGGYRLYCGRKYVTITK